ncbi:hypothetical protein SBA4_2120036 [Candidatus Sulfopaludibacter sp. SbA4]|nr:hypothetical protein SBA4_2120036 [Candidatus Sulfopaludibacter sp. SbA4]
MIGAALQPGQRWGGGANRMLVVEVPFRPEILIEGEHVAGINPVATLSPETEQQVLNFVDVDPRVVSRMRDLGIHGNERVHQRALECLAVLGIERCSLQSAEGGLERAFFEQQLTHWGAVLYCAIAHQVLPYFTSQLPAPVSHPPRSGLCAC